MKKIIFFLVSVLTLFSFSSCEKDEDMVKININSGSVVLTNLSASEFVLDRDKSADVFQQFTWSKADFGFDASVTYVLQADSAGNSFAKPVVLATVNNLLTTSVTVGALNTALLARGFEGDAIAKLEFRVIASVSTKASSVTSAVLAADVTPYSTVFPPIYMCGAATGGWDWTKGVEVLSTAPNVYQTIAVFTNGEAFRFFKQADWNPTSYNYPYFTTVDALLENALDGDSNFRFLGTTGYYKIVVNLKTKIVTMTSVAEPKMFMTGAALGGWDWSTNFVQMTWVKDNVFVATTDFAKETFRFFAQGDWGPDSYNYPYMTKVDALFENAQDGDKNFRFIGTPGSYKITLDMAAKTVVMKAQ